MRKITIIKYNKTNKSFISDEEKLNEAKKQQDTALIHGLSNFEDYIVEIKQHYLGSGYAIEEEYDNYIKPEDRGCQSGQGVTRCDLWSIYISLKVYALN